MGGEKPSRKTANKRQRSSVTPTPRKTAPEGTSPRARERAVLTFLKSGIRGKDCSPALRQHLASIPPEDPSEDVCLWSAFAAICFRIEERAWVQRALESSSKPGFTIDRLVSSGVREFAPVARAALREIIKWDEDWDDRSRRHIVDYDRLMDDLFGADLAGRAAVLDRIADDDPDDLALRSTVDALLRRASPAAVAKRRRWFPDEGEGPGEHEVEVNNIDVTNKTIHVNEENTGTEGTRTPLRRSPMIDRAKQELIAKLVEGLPSEYGAFSAVLSDLNLAFRRAVATCLEPALNSRVQSMPRETYGQKKDLVKWVNDELRRFELAIKCPKTGRPSILHADTGNHPEIGRFQLEHKDADGKRSRSLSTPELLHFELMEAAPRREALAEWQSRVGRRRGGASRE